MIRFRLAFLEFVARVMMLLRLAFALRLRLDLTGLLWLLLLALVILAVFRFFTVGLLGSVHALVVRLMLILFGLVMRRFVVMSLR